MLNELFFPYMKYWAENSNRQARQYQGALIYAGSIKSMNDTIHLL